MVLRQALWLIANRGVDRDTDGGGGTQWIASMLFGVQAYNAVAYSEGTKAFWKIELGQTEAVQSVLLDVGTPEVLDDI